MGLSSFDGDKYYLAEETKLAMAGVETLPQSSIQQNPVTDKMPAPVNATAQPMQPAPAQQAVSKPPVPAPQAPPEPPQNVYSGGPSSLPSMTRKYPNMETKMSKLRSLLDKTAMTEEDLYGSYSDDNSGYSELPEYEYEHPAMQARAGMENYTPEANYSDYMAYVPEYSREPAELDAQDIYDDYSPEQSMGYSAYEQPQSYSDMYQGYSPAQSMGYDPYQAYSNYEQMYATPGEFQGEVEDISVPQVPPEVQAYEDQRKVYEESYNQIVNYLMQMGYSAEEAQAAAPSLLGQVSVEAPTAPEGYGQSKAASYVFKTAEEKLTSRYIAQGYSPQQARQLALEYVIPESEKYASQARLIGAGLGGLGGGIGGHYAYDNEGEIGGALVGTALGALTGAVAPGLPARLRNRYVVAADAGANRVADAQKLLAAAVPGYIAHRYMANSGGDNLADRSFDLLSDAGDLAYLAGQKGIDLAKENKGALLAGGAGMGALAAGSSLANAIAKRKASAKPAKKKK